jgi:hypothetical protein
LELRELLTCNDQRGLRHANSVKLVNGNNAIAIVIVVQDRSSM